MIFKTFYIKIENKKVVDVDYIEQFDDVQDLIKSDQDLQSFIFKQISTQCKITKEDVFNYLNVQKFKDEFLLVSECDGFEDFLKNNNLVATL